MTLLEIVLRPWKAQAEIASWVEAAEYWRKRHGVVEAQLKADERELHHVLQLLAWLEIGSGIKKVDGGWIAKIYPLNAQPVHATVARAIEYGGSGD